MDAWTNGVLIASSAKEGIPYAGELAALAASLIWSVSISLYRAQGVGVPAQTLNLYKLLIATIGFTFIIAVARIAFYWGWVPTNINFPASSEKMGWLMLSGVIGFTISDTLFFAAIHRLGAQLTSALQCVTPPLSALLDFWLDPENPAKVLNTLQIVGMSVTMLAVAGVILSGSPVAGLKMGSRGWWWGIFYAIACAVLQAVSYAMISALVTKDESVLACTLVRVTPAFLVLLLMAVFTIPGRKGVRILYQSPKRLRWLTLAGILGTVIGLTLLTFGFQHAGTGVVSTLSNTYPIWLIPVASIFLREHPRPLQIVCTILAVLGIAMLAIPKELTQVWHRLTYELWF
jgi:drug/metabolite transporter (DMT)-like permease